MDKNFDSTYSRYYDLLYYDKDYEKEVPYIIELIRSVDPKAAKVLELGFGTGNHAALLCKKGYKVTGIERSEEMVTIAKEKFIDGFTPVIADIENYNLHTTFDAAISLFHVVSYLTENAALINCFKSTSEHLKDGGIFIFDVWYSPAVYHQQPETRIKRINNNDIDVIRLAEPLLHTGKNVVDVNYEIIVMDRKTKLTDVYYEKHPMRHFSIPEINLLATITGFKIIRVEEFLTANQPSENTWGVCFILQKDLNA